MAILVRSFFSCFSSIKIFCYISYSTIIYSLRRLYWINVILFYSVFIFVARNTLPIHCIIERMNSTISTNGSSSGQQHQQQQQVTGSGSCHQQSTSSSSSTPPPLNVNISNQSNTNDLSQMTNPTSTTTTSLSVSASNTSTTAGNLSNSSTSSSSSTLAAGTIIEQDTYAILPSTIPYADIIRAVLTKLGYASQEMVGAKGRWPFSFSFFIS